VTGRLPLPSAQLAFGLQAEHSGRRASVTLMSCTSPFSLSTADVGQALNLVVFRNPGLSYRIQFSRVAAYRFWHPTECGFAEPPSEQNCRPGIRDRADQTIRSRTGLPSMAACSIRPRETSRY
jgi:hypothetical protein